MPHFVLEPSSKLPQPPARRMRVLVTGATGYIASQLMPLFRERYEVVPLDVREHAGVTRADLLADSADDLRRHFRGVDAVVHLGYFRPAGMPVTGASRSYLDERPNVDMAERVYRLALEENVRRVVVASSNHAADWYEPLLHAGQLDVIGPRDLPRSDNYYGWAKIAYEALGFVYASGAFGRKLEVVQIRIGAPREIVASEFSGRPSAYARDLGAYISGRDIQQLFTRSLESSGIEDEWGMPFQIFYGISGNTRAFWSIANARKVIGYEPEDDSEVRFSDDIRRILH